MVLVVPEGYDGGGEGADWWWPGAQREPRRCDAAWRAVSTPRSWCARRRATPGQPGSLSRGRGPPSTTGADAAIPGLALSDTVKRVSVEGEETLVSSTLGTRGAGGRADPQAFRRELLVRAHASGARRQ